MDKIKVKLFYLLLIAPVTLFAFSVAISYNETNKLSTDYDIISFNYANDTLNVLIKGQMTTAIVNRDDYQYGSYPEKICSRGERLQIDTLTYCTFEPIKVTEEYVLVRSTFDKLTIQINKNDILGFHSGPTKEEWEDIFKRKNRLFWFGVLIFSVVFVLPVAFFSTR